MFFPEHDYSCSWNLANPSKQWNQNHMNQTHVKKKSNPSNDQPIKWSNDQTLQTQPIKRIYPTNGTDQTQ